jgi:hypothetical protein
MARTWQHTMGCVPGPHLLEEGRQKVKIELTEVPSFMVKGNGVDLGVFREVSQWNGLRELQNSEGHKLIISTEGNAFAVMFDELLSGTKARDATVVSASPELMARLTQAKE